MRHSQGRAEVVVGLNVVGLDPDRRAEFRGWLPLPAFPGLAGRCRGCRERRRRPAAAPANSRARGPPKGTRPRPRPTRSPSDCASPSRRTTGKPGDRRSARFGLGTARGVPPRHRSGMLRQIADKEPAPVWPSRRPRSLAGSSREILATNRSSFSRCYRNPPDKDEGGDPRGGGAKGDIAGGSETPTERPTTGGKPWPGSG